MDTSKKKLIERSVTTPDNLQLILDTIIENNIHQSLMLWGPPGIGKSSIVAQVSEARNIDLIDLRLSQLAPTDLRGLPVADHDTKTSRWYPPEFLPRDGQGILFLDEINLAPPSMQGIAQQLILDRKVGNYEVPDGWFIWSAGNRKEDYAAVFDMPGPLANRFIHFHIEPDLESFKFYGLKSGLSESILAFVSFRPDLLHKFNKQSPAWPSPRTWFMASELHKTSLDITPAVGDSAAAEFNAYIDLLDNMPDLTGILNGKGSASFPKEPSIRYAVTMGLASRSHDAEQAVNALHWMIEKSSAEWVQLLATDLLRLSRERGFIVDLARKLQASEKTKTFMSEYRTLLGMD